LGDAVLRLRERNLNQRMRRLEFLILDYQSAGAGAGGQLHDYMSLMLTYVAQERRIQKLLHSRTMIGSISKDNGTL
jgi:hypothetical protein